MPVIANWKISIKIVIILYYKKLLHGIFNTMILTYCTMKINSRIIDCYLVNQVVSFILRQAKNIVVGKVNYSNIVCLLYYASSTISF